MASKRVSQDAATKARQIAQKAKPNMRVVDVTPISDELVATPDAAVPDLEHAHRKYGVKVESETPSKELHMVTMEPKHASDAGPKRHTVVVDDEKVVGESDHINLP